MATREEIIHKINKIKESLSVELPSTPLPLPPEIWPVGDRTPETLLAAFERNLTAVAGEVVRCADRAVAVQKIIEQLQALADSRNAANAEEPLEWGIQPGERTEAVAESVCGAWGKNPNAEKNPLTRIFRPENPEDADPKKLETFAASLVGAEVLLADTGSAAICARSAFERLLCYLAPVCFIVAGQSALREHLPHAWPELSGKMKKDEAPHGEILLMTGPSRTADIEKTLILGVHGPKKVVVFIVENE